MLVMALVVGCSEPDLLHSGSDDPNKLQLPTPSGERRDGGVSEASDDAGTADGGQPLGEPEPTDPVRERTCDFSGFEQVPDASPALPDQINDSDGDVGLPPEIDIKSARITLEGNVLVIQVKFAASPLRGAPSRITVGLKHPAAVGDVVVCREEVTRNCVFVQAALVVGNSRSYAPPGPTYAVVFGTLTIDPCRSVLIYRDAPTIEIRIPVDPEAVPEVLLMAALSTVAPQLTDTLNSGVFHTPRRSDAREASESEAVNACVASCSELGGSEQ